MSNQAITQAKAIRHPFETPAGESFFKTLLWIMLILQVALFAKVTRNVYRAVPDRHGHSARR